MPNKTRRSGIGYALSAAVLMALAPIFGKQAMLMGFPPLAVVALRTILAALLLLGVMLLFQRRFLYIYPAGLLGCLLAGAVNGVGSLFYYIGLERVNAGMGHLLYSMYPLFVALWVWLDHQPLSRLTVLRLALGLPAVFLLTRSELTAVDWPGVIMMLVAAALYALHLPINQRVLYDMPAPTVTLYTLLAMSMVVVPAFIVYYIFFGTLPDGPLPAAGWQAMIGLTLVTFVSRLALALGVKHLGGMQTALLGLSEVIVVVVMAQVALGEHFSVQQWMGAGLLITSLFLAAYEKPPGRRNLTGGWLGWLHPPAAPANLDLSPHE